MNELELSICIPTYNNKDRLIKNLKTILEYEGDNIEIVIVDNKSNDSTVSEIEDIFDNRIRLFVNDETISSADNAYRAFEKARGKIRTVLSDREYIRENDLKEFLLRIKKGYWNDYLRVCDIKNGFEYRAVLYSEKKANNINQSTNKPILSICIPSYNRKHLLMYNLNRILSYDGNDLEVVVCDNASDDGTKEILEMIADNRLKVYYNKQNCGAQYNYCRSISLSSAKYSMNLNDRDHIYKWDISGYIDFLRKCDAEVVVNISDRKYGIDSVRERVYLTRLISHPGTYTMSKRIVDDFREKYKGDIEKGNRTNLGKNDDRQCFMNMLWVKSEKWEYYKSLIRIPSDIGSIKPTRRTNKRFELLPSEYCNCEMYAILFNDYIKSEDKEEYFEGCHRGCVRYYIQTWDSIRNGSFCVERFEGLEDSLRNGIDKEELLKQLCVELCKKAQNQDPVFYNTVQTQALDELDLFCKGEYL